MPIGWGGVHPEVARRAQIALQIGQSLGLQPQLTSTARSTAKQTQLRARYEACLARGERIDPSNPNPDCRYPANRPGDSSHNWGASFDSWVPEPHWPLWTAIREYVGFRVPANDRVHAEVPGWRDFANRGALSRVP